MASGSMDFRLNLLANTTGLQQGMSGAKFAVNALVAAMAAVGVGVSVQGLAQAADSYTNLSARINIATKDGGNFNQAMAGVHQIALSTNSSLEATGNLFTRINDTGKQMGLTQQQSLDLTKTINQAIQIGGGSAQASEAAITQLSQALQSGVLRGDEFNSIMEQAPGLTKALAAGLGVTTGELRKMAEAGELSSERVVKAISSQGASIQATYDKFPTTIGNALQRISTSWEILIGKMDQANGASSTVAQWLVMLADNIAELDVVLNDIGEGFVWVGDQLKKIDPATIEALKTALLSAYEALKNVASTLGEAFVVTVDLLNTALGSVFDFESGVDGLSDKTNGLTKLFQALNVIIGFISDGFSGIKIGVNLLAGAIYDVAAAFTYWKSKLLFGEYKDAALKEYEELAQKAQSYYSKASDDAINFKSKGLEAVEEISKTQKEKDADIVASSKAKLAQLLADQKTEVSGKKASEDEKISAVKAYAEAAVAANNGVLSGIIQAELTTQGYIVTLDQSGKVAVTSLNEAKKATEENIKATELAKERAKQAEQSYQDFIKSSAAERINLTKQIEEAKKSGDLNALLSAQTSLAAIDAKEKELNEARKARSAEVVAGIQGSADKARKAASALGVDLDIALNRVSEGFKANETNVVNLANGIDRLGAKGKQAGEITYHAWVKWLDAAKSQTEVDYAKQKLEEFGTQGKLSTIQVEQGMQAIRQVVQKLPADLDPVEQAFERLGIKTKEQLKLAAQSVLADFSTIQNSGKATAESLKRAYERTMQAAAASGDQATIASTRAKAASLGLEVQITDTGKVTVDAGSRMETSMHRVRDATSGARQSFRELGATAREEALSSTEAWAQALDAQNSTGGMHATPKGSKTRLAFDQGGVEAELKTMGYDEKKAAQIAKSILEGSKSGNGYKNASKSWLAENDLDVIGSFSGGGGGTSNANYVREQLERYSQYSGNSSAKLDGGGSKTVKYEISTGKNTATVYGSPSTETNLNSILGELEAIKKST